MAEQNRPDGVINLQGRDYATYPYVLNAAHEAGLQCIATRLLEIPDDANGQVAIVEAVVTLNGGKTFTAIGDASPRSVKSSLVPHIIRMAETRAKGRAMRDAVNIGQTLAEELGDDAPHDAPAPRPPAQPKVAPSGNGGGAPKCIACGVPLTSAEADECAEKGWKPSHRSCREKAAKEREAKAAKEREAKAAKERESAEAEAARKG